MPKRRARSTIPAFRSEAVERRFWETHDTSPFVDWSKARVAVFPNLKPSTFTLLRDKVPEQIRNDPKVIEAYLGPPEEDW